MQFARAQGLTLNCFVTINAFGTDCDLDRALTGLEYVRDQAAKWFAYHSCRTLTPYAAVWVMENPNSRLHLHWLLHLPEGLWLAFEAMLHKWVRRGLGVPEPDAIHMADADGNAINYILKGQAPGYVSNPRWRSIQGPVWGKRCGMSQSLGPAAREKAASPSQDNVFQ